METDKPTGQLEQRDDFSRMQFIALDFPEADAGRIADEYRMSGQRASAAGDCILACRYYSAALYVEFTCGRLRWSDLNRTMNLLREEGAVHVRKTLGKDRNVQDRKSMNKHREF